MQTINRNNYEEYFLLYADNELDTAIKLMVENFVQQNADLAVELEMLMQTKFKPEELLFNDKETLLRTVGTSINETNYEEYFLLYIDNELSTAKRTEVEKYVLQHPAMQDEFTTLKQSVLPIENIGYGNKEALYKTEKRRTAYFKPWRLAAAAIFIGVCAIGVWLMQKPVNPSKLVKNNLQQLQQQAKVQEQATAGKQKAGKDVIPADSTQQVQPLQTAVAPQQSLALNQKKTVDKKIILKKNDTELPGNKEAVANRRLKHPADKHAGIDITDIVKQDEEPVTHDNDVAIEMLPSNKNIITASPQKDLTNSTGENNNGYKIYNVAYKEIDPNSDDNSLHVGAFDLNKNKVKTLLKKAGRLFSNKQNKTGDNNGKLQIANFQINTVNQ